MHRRKRQQKRPARHVGTIILWLILIAVLCWLGTSLVGAWTALSGRVNKADWDRTLNVSGQIVGNRIIVAALGVDDRNGERGRSDTILVASMDPKANDVRLMSIPRDTFVHIPGKGYDKVNHAYAFGGEKLAVQTVAEYLNIPIDHYAVVDFSGFKAVVDAVGGVDINVLKQMDYEDPYDANGGLYIHFKPGVQHMDGQKALEYARFRKDEEGDMGRMRRQQEVIKAVLSKAMSPSVITKIPSLVTSTSKAVRTDMGIRDLLTLGSTGKDVLGKGQVNSATLPAGQEQTLNGGFYFVPDLLQVRSEAYRTLLGTELPERLQTKAREDQDAMIKELAGWNAPKAADVRPPAALPAGKTGTEAPVAAPVAAPVPTPVPAPVAGGEKANPAAQAPAQPKPTPAPAPRVAIIDMSGLTSRTSLISRWGSFLQSNQFLVVQAGRGDSTQPSTVIIDRSTNNTLTPKLKELFPHATIQAGTSNGQYEVEIRIGQDAISWSKP